MRIGAKPDVEFGPFGPMHARGQGSVLPEVRNHQHNYIVVLTPRQPAISRPGHGLFAWGHQRSCRPGMGSPRS